MEYPTHHVPQQPPRQTLEAISGAPLTLQMVMILCLTILICTMGILAIYLQFQQLWKAIDRYKNYDADTSSSQLGTSTRRASAYDEDNIIVDDTTTPAGALEAVRSGLRKKHELSHHEMTKELQNMKEMQRDVKAKLVGLKQLVKQFEEKPSKKNTSNHKATSAKPKSS